MPLVAEVLIGTTNINQALVAAGAAFVYWHYIEGCDRETYSRLENEARLKSFGVWAVPGGIQRPWDYRSGRRSSGSAPNRGRFGLSPPHWSLQKASELEKGPDLIPDATKWLLTSLSLLKCSFFWP